MGINSKSIFIPSKFAPKTKVVSVSCDGDFGPYEVHQPTDGRAVQHVIENQIKPIMAHGIDLGVVTVTCGEAQRVLGG